MLKIGVAIAVPLVVGFIAFPQFRVAILGLAPFALFALCPLGMLFGMKGMMGDKKNNQCSQCDHEQHNKKVHEKPLPRTTTPRSSGRGSDEDTRSEVPKAPHARSWVRGLLDK